MPSNNVTETDYKKLRNRCRFCGHRLNMMASATSVKVCGVINGDQHDPSKTTPCPCRKHNKEFQS